MDATTGATNATLFTYPNTDDLVKMKWRGRDINVLDPVVLTNRVLNEHQSKIASVYTKMDIFLKDGPNKHRNCILLEAQQNYKTYTANADPFIKAVFKLKSSENYKQLITEHFKFYQMSKNWVQYSLNSDSTVMRALAENCVNTDIKPSARYFYWDAMVKACTAISLWGISFHSVRTSKGTKDDVGAYADDGKIFCELMEYTSYFNICNVAGSEFKRCKIITDKMLAPIFRFRRQLCSDFIVLVHKQNSLLPTVEKSISIQNIIFEMVENLNIDEHMSQAVTDLILSYMVVFLSSSQNLMKCADADMEESDKFNDTIDELFNMLAMSIILKKREIAGWVMNMLVYYVNMHENVDVNDSRLLQDTIDQHFEQIKEMIISMAKYGCLSASKKEQRYEWLYFLEQVTTDISDLTDKSSEILAVINKAQSELKKKKPAKQKKAKSASKKADKQEKSRSVTNDQSTTKNVSLEDGQIEPSVEKEQMYRINLDVLLKGYKPFDSEQLNPIIQYVIRKINGSDVSNLEMTYDAVREVDSTAVSECNKYAAWYAVLQKNISLIESVSEKLAVARSYFDQFSAHVADLDPQSNADRDIDRNFITAYRSMPQLIVEFKSCFSQLRNCVSQDILTYASNAQLSLEEKSDLKLLLSKLSGYIDSYPQTADLCKEGARAFLLRGQLIQSVNYSGFIRKSNRIVESGIDDSKLLVVIQQFAREFEASDLSQEVDLSQRIRAVAEQL